MMAIDHPKSVMGIYLTDLGWQTSFVDPSILSKKEQHYLEEGTEGIHETRSICDGSNDKTTIAGL